MPWYPADASKHNKGLSAKGKRQWADVANSVLKKTGNDALAIREANSVVSRSAIKRRISKGK